VGASYSSGTRCPSVCLSHMNISNTKQDRHMVTRKLGFLIQNLPSISQSEVQFRHFWCFRVSHSDKNGPVGLVTVVNGSVEQSPVGTTLGIMVGQLSSRPMMDDTLFLLVLRCSIKKFL